MALVVIAASLYLVFGQGELAAGLIGLFFVLGSIVLMVRIIVEIFGRVGIRQEEEWFREAFMSAGYLPPPIPSVKSNETKDL
jgi:hypothetical protein